MNDQTNQPTSAPPKKNKQKQTTDNMLQDVIAQDDSRSSVISICKITISHFLQ